MQVLLDDDPKLHENSNIFAEPSSSAKNGGDLLCCHHHLSRRHGESRAGSLENADLSLTFSEVKKMNTLLKGGLALPSIKGKLSMLPPVLSVFWD